LSLGLGLHGILLPFGFSTRTLCRFPFSPLRSTCSVLRRIHVIISSLYSFLWCPHIFTLLRSKYSPQHLNTLSLSFPKWQRLSSIPIQNHMQNCSFTFFNFYVFKQQAGRQKVLNSTVSSTALYFCFN
jgi:hypothetical protein